MRRGRNSKKKIRVLIADREGVFRLGLKKLFGVEDDLRVVAQAATAGQVIAGAKSFRPDLFFVQMEMLTEEPHNLVNEVRREAPESKLVVTASVMAENEALRHVEAGAAGVILKSVEPALFVKCARKVMDNEVWLPRRPVAKMLETNPDRPLRPIDTLTRREKTIISYLMQGWRNREIAHHLSISEQTVKNHLRTVYDKVGVSDRLELVLFAIHQHLELPPVQLLATPA
jgi:DNA-binding NarL/FixJ family response regulator